MAKSGTADKTDQTAELDALRQRLQRLALFQDITDQTLAVWASEIEWFSLPGGWTLFRQGDVADAIYMVTAGCLAALATDDRGRTRSVAQMRSGEIVGEMAVISGEPRSATVVALRDTELLRLSKPVFDRLIESHPKSMLQLTRVLVHRLQLATRRTAPTTACKVFALLPLGPDVALAKLADGLAVVLGAGGARVRVLDAASAEQTTEWHHEVESAHDIVLYRAESTASAWTRLCLRQADRVLLIAQGAPPAELALDPVLQGLSGERLDLVVLHQAKTGRATGADPWLRRLPVGFHSHVRLDRPGEYARLGRFLTNQAVGLVLAGGGARGFAHIGAVRALRQAGLALDLVGGTSMGAIVAACVGLGWDDAEIRDRMRQAFYRTKPFSDYTVPFVALLKGRKVTRLLRHHFGEARLEDLWRPYFCMSSNLTSGQPMVHRDGPLWRALRASIAIPGVLPPVVEAGEILVDGGVINNFPADVMAGFGRGPVVGVDVASDRALTSGAELLDTGYLPWVFRRRDQRVPGIFSLLVRAGTVGSEAKAVTGRGLVDLLLEPPLEAIDMLDWRAFDRAVEAGYRYTMETLDKMEKPPFPVAVG